jgi:RNA polymerase sigma-70 factor (ECF subfamily)
MSDLHGLEPLLDRARTGDRPAWNALLDRLRPIIRALLRRQMRHDGDASDLAQEVQLRMDRGFGRFRGQSVPQLLAWVRQIAARVLIDHHRRRQPVFEPLGLNLPQRSGPSAGMGSSHAEKMAQVAEALERLPPHYRAVLEARLVDGLRCVTIAERIGQTPGWVRVVCKRAFDRLRKEMEISP